MAALMKYIVCSSGGRLMLVLLSNFLHLELARQELREKNGGMR